MARPPRRPSSPNALYAAAAALTAAIGILWLFADANGVDGRLFFGAWRTRHMALAIGLAALAGGLTCSWRSREALFGFVAAGLLLATTWAILELAGQLGLIAYAERFGNRGEIATNTVGSTPRPHLDLTGETFQDTATAWGIEHEAIPFHYRTDARGFRNSTDRDAAQVYLLGDSVVVAGLLPFEETVAARLEAGLGQPVMNVALIGIGPEREHQLFREAGLPVAGRVVLQFLFEGNDWVDPPPDAPESTPSRSQRIRRRSFSVQTVLAMQRWTQPVVGLASRRRCQIGDRDYLFHYAFQSFAGYKAREDEIFSALGTFAREIEAAGGRFATVFIPTKLRVLGPACERWPATSDLRTAVDANPLRARVARWGAATGTPGVDLTDPLRAAAQSNDIPWFWGDTHWNAAGHAAAAAALLESPMLR